MKVQVAQLCLPLWSPMDYTVHGILQARILQWVAFPFSRALPNPGIEPRVPTLQVDSLPAKPQGKPKNTGMGSLSLLQWIFLTQESNWGLLHCRRTLYQLRYRGSPVADEKTLINSLLISLILYMGKLKDRQNKKWPQRSLILRSLQTGLSSQSVWLQSLTLPSPLSSPSALPCF